MTQDNHQHSQHGFIDFMLNQATPEQSAFVVRCLVEWNRLPGHNLEGQPLPEGYAA